MRRREVLVAGGLVGVAVAIPPLLRWRARMAPFEFAQISGLPDFRRVRTGATSGASSLATIGLSDPTAPTVPALSSADIDEAAFGLTPDGTLNLAVFTDYNCPFCGVLSERLITRVERGEAIRLNWYELPLLGPASRRSAQAALAAGEQGAYLDVHRHLMRTNLRPGPVALRKLADQFNLDPTTFIADATGPLPDRHFARAKGLARLFGIGGTPGTVVGRTVVLGAIDPNQMDRLIALERERLT